MVPSGKDSISFLETFGKWLVPCTHSYFTAGDYIKWYQKHFIVVVLRPGGVTGMKVIDKTEESYLVQDKLVIMLA